MSCVYIGNLSYRAREKDVEYFFRGYGRTFGISLKNGYGFIEFDDYRDADDAVYELNGKDLCGERVSLEHSRSAPHGRDRDRLIGRSGRDRDRYDRGGGGGGGGRGAPPIRTEHRLLVQNLSSRSNWKDLKDLMREVGDVMYADCHRTRTGEGIVEFSNREDMKRALKKLDGEELNGKRIKLVEDCPRRSSHRSRTRSRSRSRHGRSRSHSPAPRKRNHSSRSRSRSRSRSVSRGRLNNKSRSRSKSPQKIKSRPKSASPNDDRKSSASRSRSRSLSQSSSKRKSKSLSPNPDQKKEMVNGKDVNGDDEVESEIKDDMDDGTNDSNA